MSDDKTIKSRIANQWNTRSSEYDNCYAHGLKSEREKQEWLKLMDAVIDKDHARILDVGAGTGFLSLFEAELGHTCKGLDLSENMLSEGRKKAEKAAMPLAERLMNPHKRLVIIGVKKTGKK